MKRFLPVGSALGLAALVLSGTSAFASVSGAIYTTLPDASEVNFNIYGAKEDVYLNGGPGRGAGTNAPGLRPDGVYIFMVTSPSGELLSTDNAECRQVQVTDGVIVGAVGPCPHAVGGASVGTPVQLMPYNDTPNPGGEYKAWLTPADKYLCPLDEVTCESGRNGFINSESKTDNFKVKSIPDEIDTRFYGPDGHLLDNRSVTWFDTHGASNAKWSYYDPSRWIMHEAHVEAPEVGNHYISIADQDGCKVGTVFVDGRKTKTEGPQTVSVRVTNGMKKKGEFTIFIDVYCTSIN